MPRSRILVVDDEKLIRWTLRERLEESGYAVVDAETGTEGLFLVDEGVDLVLLDVKLPDLDGLDVLRRIRERHPDTLVILITALATVENAVEAMKRGAWHYLNKPIDLDELLHYVEKALETTRLRREVKSLKAKESAPFSFDRIIGESPAMRTVKDLLRKIALSPASTILLTGESGTGKDLAAKVLHYESDRAEGVFQNITCSALPESLLESELFGHERGAFTDAKHQKPGLLEQADGGTVFLDEIAEMTPALQAKLLRFLEEKTFRRVGGTADLRVDVRVVAATNRNLEESVRSGRFRDDLYYRLQVLPVTLPPLRERTGDVAVLASHFVAQFAREFKKGVWGLTSEAVRHLEAYSWPGNVRELKNAVERAVLLAEEERLVPGDFPLRGLAVAAADAFRLPPGGIDLEELERDLLVQALQRTSGNQTQAARLLHLNRDQIRYRIEKFGLEKPEPAAGR
ncbi:MAG: sigma-54-dependent transcriptional regulator [Acidithiobacillales bacterium]